MTLQAFAIVLLLVANLKVAAHFSEQKGYLYSDVCCNLKTTKQSQDSDLLFSVTCIFVLSARGKFDRNVCAAAFPAVGSSSEAFSAFIRKSKWCFANTLY